MAMRIAGFSASSLAVRSALGVILMYLVPLAGIVLAAAYGWWTHARPPMLAGVAGRLSRLRARLDAAWPTLGPQGWRGLTPRLRR